LQVKIKTLGFIHLLSRMNANRLSCWITCIGLVTILLRIVFLVMQHSRIGEHWTILRSLWKVAVLRDRRNEFQPGDSIAFEKVSRWLHRAIRWRVTWPLSPLTRREFSQPISWSTSVYMSKQILHISIFITEFNRTCSHYLWIINFTENLYRRRYHRVSTFFIHSLILNFLHPNLPFIDVNRWK